ncbi:hypothetical protein E4P29_19815 [Rhodococcus sp. 1R11]|uniref:hypothetical protein n=1 Tax=Rhodococcus sp. 1R11 TaxID=2559614 RepID=UPI001071DE14|nr:hypothetical protein [Rhodococcus sp. 1R11]TFI41755.1 hypothetical protein E4P29_19815 [Rhodococcus sp. 1R11]
MRRFSTHRGVCRAVLTALMTVSLGVLIAPTAFADCAGFGSETERVTFARDRAAIAAIATPTAVETTPRPPSGGLPVAVYTFTIDTGIKGVEAGESVKVAAPQDNSNARTFEIGRRYFLAPTESRQDSGGGDLTRLAPYADNACSPTAALDELSPAFANQWTPTSTSSTAAPTGSATPLAIEGDMVDDGSTGDDGAGPILLGVVAVVVVVAGGSVLLVRRLRR